MAACMELVCTLEIYPCAQVQHQSYAKSQPECSETGDPWLPWRGRFDFAPMTRVCPKVGVVRLAATARSLHTRVRAGPIIGTATHVA